MQNLISANSGAITMSSIELVEFINSQRGEGEATLAHSDFLKKVPQVLGEKDAGKFSSIYRDSMNREKPCYRFPKREACLMAMSYSYELQAKVFDRMTALESQAAKPFAIPQSLPEALRLAADLADQKAQAEAALAIAAPKAKALDRIATAADGSMCITNAAKALQIQPKALFGWLQSNDWIYRRAGGSGFVAYQPRIKQGVLEHKVTTVERSDGGSKTIEQVLVTSKGLATLAKRFSAGCA